MRLSDPRSSKMPDSCNSARDVGDHVASPVSQSLDPKNKEDHFRRNTLDGKSRGRSRLGTDNIVSALSNCRSLGYYRFSAKLQPLACVHSESPRLRTYITYIYQTSLSIFTFEEVLLPYQRQGHLYEPNFPSNFPTC